MQPHSNCKVTSIKAHLDGYSYDFLGSSLSLQTYMEIVDMQVTLPSIGPHCIGVRTRAKLEYLRRCSYNPSISLFNTRGKR